MKHSIPPEIIDTAVKNLVPVLSNVKDDKEISVLFNREVRRLMQDWHMDWTVSLC